MGEPNPNPNPPNPNPNPPPPPAPVDHSKDIAELKSQNAALMAKIEALTKPPPDDPGLQEKARKEREEADKKKSDVKALEKSLQFNMGSKDFVKLNENLLPKNVTDILSVAEKETYDSAIQKAQAIKTGIIESFFMVQANLDLLTPGLKTTLEEYLKLTKNGKQDRAIEVYESVFEPAFEMLKRVKKAEALGKGHSYDTNDDTAYKNKLMAGSKKHHLGEK
jgi:hypothetical protein